MAQFNTPTSTALYVEFLTALGEVDNPKVDEIGIVPSALPVNTDGNGGSFLCVDNKLGIPNNLVPSLYGYARQRLWQYEQRVEPCVLWPNYQATPNVPTQLSSPSTINNNEIDVNNEIEMASRCLMLLQPENYTAINVRRRMLFKEKSLSLNNELHWTSVALTAPNGRKSGVGWHYRRSLLLHPLIEWTPAVMERELKLTERAFTLHQRNYYAWTQRAWLMEQASVAFANSASYTQLIDNEDEFTDGWTATHLSDSAAWHYRRRVLANRTVVTCWHKEMERVYDLITRYPGHEAIWCHLRLVATSLLEMVTAREREDQFKFTLDWSNELKRELAMQLQVNTMAHTTNELSNALQHQLRHANAYETWINYTNRRLNEMTMKEGDVHLALGLPLKQLL
ncbi:hypothetical protein BDF22DRAFT_697906 [Syncephalis plumigaleata]|nr:hypothetical protein BDF22DRAFT_697906 [Syncephalis plumigaleata]